MKALVRLARNGLLGVALSVATVSVTSIPQTSYAMGFGDLPLVQSLRHNTGGLVFTGLGAAMLVGAGIAGVLSAPAWVPAVLIGGGLVAAGIGLYKLFSGFMGLFGGGGPKTPSLPGQGPREPKAPVPIVGHNGPVPSPPTVGGNGGGGFPHHGPVANPVTGPSPSGQAGTQVGRNTPTTGSL